MISTLSVRKVFCIHYCYFLFLVLYQFCGNGCSRIAPDLHNARGRGNKPYFFKYISLPVVRIIVTVFTILWNYWEAIKIEVKWMATIICREMHKKSFRKRVVFYKRPIRRCNNFQKLPQCIVFSAVLNFFIVMFHCHIYIFQVLINFCMAKCCHFNLFSFKNRSIFLYSRSSLVDIMSGFQPGWD